jgi:hypothetical protein
VHEAALFIEAAMFCQPVDRTIPWMSLPIERHAHLGEGAPQLRASGRGDRQANGGSASTVAQLVQTGFTISAGPLEPPNCKPLKFRAYSVKANVAPLVLVAFFMVLGLAQLGSSDEVEVLFWDCRVEQADILS